MVRVLVPIDGSGAATCAVREAVALGNQLTQPLEILLLNVRPHAPWADLMLSGKPSELETFAQQQRAAGEKILQEAQAIAQSAGPACRGFVEMGDAPYVNNDYVSQYHCDQIVMGGRGLGRFGGLLPGSVATKVLHLAQVPVMLVK